jgi:acylphosphatase
MLLTLQLSQKMIKHLDIIVKGKVQGVFYRASTKAVADQLGVKGYVKNESNGDVTIAAEGDNLSLEMFLDWCKEGPEDAMVTSVESHEGELKNYRNFDVAKKGIF